MVEAYTQLREQERPEVDPNEVDYNPEARSGDTQLLTNHTFRGRAEELSELMAEGLRYGRTTAMQSGLYPYDEDTRQSDIPRDDIITHANEWLVQESEFDYQTLESVMNAASLQDAVDWAWEQLDGPSYQFNLATFLSGGNAFNPVGDIFTGDFEWGRTPDRLKEFRPNPYADQSLGERTGIRNWGDAVYAILDVIDMAALVMGGEVVRPIWNALKKTDDPLRAWGQVVEAYRPPPIHGGVAKTGHSQELIDFYSTSRMIDNIERPGRKGRGLSIDEVALSQSDRALDPVRYTEMPYTSIPDGQMDAFFEHWDSIGQEAPTIWVRTDLLEDYGHGFAIKEAEVAMRSATAAAPPAAAADATARAEMQAAREAAQEGLPGTPQGGVAAWEGGPTLLHGTGNDRLPRRMQTDVTGSRIPGLYATDSLELAERYAGTEGFVHNLQWTGDRPPRVLDVSNDPVSPELKQAIIEAGPAPAYVTRFDGEGEWAAYVEAKLKDNAITVEKLMFEPFMSDPTRRAIPNVFDVVSEDVGGSLEYIFLDRSKVGIAGRLEGLPGTPTGDADRLAAALRNDEGLDLFDHYKRLAKESGYLDDMENGFGRIREWDINLPGVIGQTGPGNWARVASNDPTQWESQFDALLRRNLEGVTPQKPVEMHQLFKDVEEYASRRLDEMLEGLPGTQLGRSIEGWDYGNNLAKEMADEGMPVSNQDLHDGLYEYYSDAYDMVHPMEGLGGHPGAPSQPEIVVTGIGDELSQLNKRNWIEARIEQFHDLYPYARRQPDAGESLNLARDPALAPRDRDIAEAETMFNDIFDIIKRHKDPTIPRATYEDTAILNLRNRWDTYSSEEQDSAYRFYLEGIREEWRPYDIDDLTESEIDEFLAATLRYQTTGIHLTRESQDALYRTDWLDLDELKRADIEETWRRMHPDQALRRETDPLDEIEDIANVMRWWNEGGGSSYLEGLPGTPEAYLDEIRSDPESFYGTRGLTQAQIDGGMRTSSADLDQMSWEQMFDLMRNASDPVYGHIEDEFMRRYNFLYGLKDQFVDHPQLDDFLRVFPEMTYPPETFGDMIAFAADPDLGTFGSDQADFITKIARDIDEWWGEFRGGLVDGLPGTPEVVVNPDAFFTNDDIAGVLGISEEEAKRVVAGTGRADDFYKDIPLAERTPEQWTTPRRLGVWQMRQQGMTYREIGEHFGFSPERARRVVADAEHDFAYRDEYLANLRSWRGEPEISRLDGPPGTPEGLAISDEPVSAYDEEALRGEISDQTYSDFLHLEDMDDIGDMFRRKIPDFTPLGQPPMGYRDILAMDSDELLARHLGNEDAATSEWYVARLEAELVDLQGTLDAGLVKGRAKIEHRINEIYAEFETGGFWKNFHGTLRRDRWPQGGRPLDPGGRSGGYGERLDFTLDEIDEIVRNNGLTDEELKRLMEGD